MIKATTISRKQGAYGDVWVYTRVEIEWLPGQWYSCGLQLHEEKDWRLLCLVMALGCRRASIKFEHKEIPLAKYPTPTPSSLHGDSRATSTPASTTER